MKIIVTGGTGLVGAEVIRQAILDDAIEQITVIVRRPLAIVHPKVIVILHQDFLDYSIFTEIFRGHDAFLWCLGISQTQVDKGQYHVITYDYTIAAAKAMQNANPDMLFLFLSGEGADLTEKSRTLFARVKGMTENTLMKMGLKKLYIVRPGGIKPIHKNPNTSLVNKIMIPFFPLLELLVPSMVISSVQLAVSMIYISKYGADKTILKNSDLKSIALSIEKKELYNS